MKAVPAFGALASAPASPPEPVAAAGGEASGTTQRALLLIVAGLLLVIALYFVTVVSKRAAAPITPAPMPTAQAPAAAPAGPLPSNEAPLPTGIAEEVAALEAQVEATEGAARQSVREALVNLLVGAGRPDRAAPVQEALAQETGTAEAWRRAGNLYYDWMEAVDGTAKMPLAQRAIAAYQQVLAETPDDLDVRTDMAWAYQYDPQNPMEAITQTNLVLEQNPDHIAANFNKGIFLMRIRRFDQAITQFERVKEIVGAGSPYYAQADVAIETLREMQQEEAGGNG